MLKLGHVLKFSMCDRFPSLPMDYNEVKFGSFIHGKRKRYVPGMKTTVFLKHEDLVLFKVKLEESVEK